MNYTHPGRSIIFPRQNLAQQKMAVNSTAISHVNIPKIVLIGFRNIYSWLKIYFIAPFPPCSQFSRANSYELLSSGLKYNVQPYILSWSLSSHDITMSFLTKHAPSKASATPKNVHNLEVSETRWYMVVPKIIQIRPWFWGSPI